MQLRRTLTLAAVGLGLITLTACVALVLSTTLLRRTADNLDRAHQVARLASSLAHQSIRFELETTSMGRSLSEAQGRVLLARAIGLTRSPDERQVFENLRPQLERHWRSAANGDVRLAPDLVSALVRVDDLFSAKADAESRRARTIDMMANVIGVGIALLLAAGVVFFLWTINQFVFRPVKLLASSVDRFAAGDMTVRVPVGGAEEIRRIAIAQNTMADALARTREDQLRYVATVIHDLRNPLAAVQLAVGYVTPNRPLPSEERLREIFGMIGRQLRRLNSLVGDVLNAVQIEAGHIVLRKTTFDLGELAQEAVSLFRSMSPYHRFDLSRRGSTTLRADATRLEQVLNNLIGNAVKYSPQGSLVHVTVGGEDDSLFIAVSDEGPGISPTLRRQIFRPFTRGPSEHEEVEGIGLGLYVSKRILEAHGGSIEVLSSDGPGATFQATLPRGLVGAAAETEPVVHPPSREQWSPA
ncbi:MAG TPA: ATP-binding protein [Polyangia bacterium]|jgi:signal transduction histidine kinase|nr:ATP-binding protein [Polyangia bacterium]